MDMYKYLIVLSAALTQDTQNTLLGKLGEYGVLGIVLGIMLWKDYKNEIFLQGLIGDLKKSLDKLSDKIENTISKLR